MKTQTGPASVPFKKKKKSFGEGGWVVGGGGGGGRDVYNVPPVLGERDQFQRCGIRCKYLSFFLRLPPLKTPL